jgi:hypothetical protein
MRLSGSQSETAASFKARRAAPPSAKIAQLIIGQVMIEVGRRQDAGTHRPLRHTGNQRFVRARKSRVGTIPNEASLSLHEIPASKRNESTLPNTTCFNFKGLIHVHAQ